MKDIIKSIEEEPISIKKIKELRDTIYGKVSNSQKISTWGTFEQDKKFSQLLSKTFNIKILHPITLYYTQTLNSLIGHLIDLRTQSLHFEIRDKIINKKKSIVYKAIFFSYIVFVVILILVLLFN